MFGCIHTRTRTHTHTHTHTHHTSHPFEFPKIWNIFDYSKTLSHACGRTRAYSSPRTQVINERGDLLIIEKKFTLLNEMMEWANMEVALRWV